MKKKKNEDWLLKNAFFHKGFRKIKTKNTHFCINYWWINCLYIRRNNLIQTRRHLLLRFYKRNTRFESFRDSVHLNNSLQSIYLKYRRRILKNREVKRIYECIFVSFFFLIELEEEVIWPWEFQCVSYVTGIRYKIDLISLLL